MRVVAVGARGCVLIALFEQQLAVPAGAELGQLTDVKPVLAHLVGIGVAGGAELDGLETVGRANVVG